MLPSTQGELFGIDLRIDVLAVPASELLAVANARARLPTWLASQVSSLVTRA